MVTLSLAAWPMDGRGAVKGFEPSDKTIPEISLDVSAPLPVAEAYEDMMTREVNQSELCIVY